MKTAGKAFTMGAFGTLGAATVLIGGFATLVIIGERKVRRILRDFERDTKAAYDRLTDPDSPVPDDKV